MIDDQRGILYPARTPQLHRLPAPPPAAALAEWFWIPEWEIEPGGSSRQHIVSHPALNLVVDTDRVVLVGATTRVSHRDLTGRGRGIGSKQLQPSPSGSSNVSARSDRRRCRRTTWRRCSFLMTRF